MLGEVVGEVTDGMFVNRTEIERRLAYLGEALVSSNSVLQVCFFVLSL